MWSRTEINAKRFSSFLLNPERDHNVPLMAGYSLLVTRHKRMVENMLTNWCNSLSSIFLSIAFEILQMGGSQGSTSYIPQNNNGFSLAYVFLCLSLLLFLIWLELIQINWVPKIESRNETEIHVHIRGEDNFDYSEESSFLEHYTILCKILLNSYKNEKPNFFLPNMGCKKVRFTFILMTAVICNSIYTDRWLIDSSYL